MKSIAILLLLLFPFLLQAQSNYKKGYVVTTAGNTLPGFIDFKEWVKNPEAIIFKSSAESTDLQKFTPDNCSSFEIADLETYHSFKVRISLDEVVLPKLSTGVDTSSQTETVFLKVLQSGKNVTLYAYRDAIKTRFYLRHHDQDKPEELIYQIYYKPRELNVTQQFTVQSKIYVGQLWLAATKYNVATPELNKQLQGATYSENNILRIVSKINQIENSRAKQKKTDHPRTRFFAGIGVNRTASTFTGRDHALTYKTEWDEQNSINLVRPSQKKEDLTFKPKIDAGLDFIPFPKTKRLMLRGQVNFALAEFAFSNVHDQRVQRREIIFNYTGQQLLTSLSAQLLYNLYNADNIKFYLGTGFAYNVSYYLKNTLYMKINTTGQGSEESESENYMPLDRFWANFPMRAGLTFYKNIDLSVNYWPTVGLLPGVITNDVNYLQFEINYIFNKKAAKL